MTSPKLSSLRAEMKKRGIDGFFVPRADEFQGEYVPASSGRLEWLTGFDGSAGSAVATQDKAAFFTDGRYTIQARAQVDAQAFDICSISENQGVTPTLTPAQWIEKNLPAGSAFGIDPWLHTAAEAKRIGEAVARAGGRLVLLEDNPLDAAWGGDRPAAPVTPAAPHPLEFAGVSSAAKRAEVARALQNAGADALSVTLPEEICWLLNIRGGDVPCTPFVLSYALAHADGTVDLFADEKKISAETRKWLGSDVRLHPLADFAGHAAQLAQAGKTLWADPGATPAKIDSIVSGHGGKTHAARSPLQLMKARKNAVEIQGAVKAHIRDGVAETRFLAAISAPGAAARLDEISAADLLEKFRSEGENFRGLSFDTISGAGGNGAIVHYRATPETKKDLLAGPVYLVDSGGQYLDGTTDITRTVAVDPAKVTPEMKDRFTRVLQGHIRVAMAVFPAGTTGDKLDEKARGALKEAGLDYAHGTGHGVGSYLSVHEGPCGISPLSKTVPLEPGMVISNEPGFYKEGAYGIRIESLVTVTDTGTKDADGKQLLAFRTLTMAPIDRNLIEPAMMKDEELDWLNSYHETVRNTLTPLLEQKDPAAAAFLQTATAPLRKPGAPAARPGKISGFFL